MGERNMKDAWKEISRRPSGLLRLFDSHGQGGFYSYFQTQDIVTETRSLDETHFDMRERYEDKPPVYIHENGDVWEAFKVASIVFPRLLEKAEKQKF